MLALFYMMGVLSGGIIGIRVVERKAKESTDKMKELSDKHLALFIMMNQWVRIKQQGKSLADYFIRENYKKIAVYGMGYVGQTLIKELQNTTIEVVYGIDKKLSGVYENIDIITTDDELEGADVIVVTAITHYEEIVSNLKNRVKCPIISLEDILYQD